MCMKLYEEQQLKFGNPDWKNDPELGFIDTLLEAHPELIKFLASDISAGLTDSNFGRGDVPSVEQIVRAALFKEVKGLQTKGLKVPRSSVCPERLKNMRILYENKSGKAIQFSSVSFEGRNQY